MIDKRIMSTKEDETLTREKNKQVRRYKISISNSPSTITSKETQQT